MKNNTGNLKYSVILIAFAAIVISTFTLVFASERIEKTLDDVNAEIKTNSDVFQLTYPLKEYVISNKFGGRTHPITGVEIVHSGIDLAAEKGEEIYAVMDGAVTFADYETKTGNTVKIKHSDGTSSMYAHGSELLVEAGDTVKAGQVIMKVGATGLATGPHLHFEMEDKNGELIDVNKFFE